MTHDPDRAAQRHVEGRFFPRERHERTTFSDRKGSTGGVSPENLQVGGKDCNAPVPSSEGGHIPGAAGSLTPRTIPDAEAA